MRQAIPTPAPAHEELELATSWVFLNLRLEFRNHKLAWVIVNRKLDMKPWTEGEVKTSP